MGILNVTPDSFYDGGKFNASDLALKRAENILRDGGKIIDIGGYSSRPGADNVAEQDELKRVIPVIENIRQRFPSAFISVDTFRSNVAKEAVAAGAHIINDISGGDGDVNMFTTIAKLNVPYIMMHMQGTPQNMQINPTYTNVTNDIISYFEKKIDKLTSLGATDILLDPGFGFGKTIEHNYTLLKRLSEFCKLNRPLLIGISRKSMIYKKLGITAEESLAGTIALNAIALEKGASILRVHDVKEAVDLVTLLR
ncbi:dihydropteroate synthase [Flavobacteriales bacterium]|nr:dihydropteroate synthase [Flavobacteriales bacterium]